MTTSIMKWRISTTLAGLPNGGMVVRGLGAPFQPEPKDHTTRKAQSEGGIARHGYKNYKLLYRDLDEVQANILRDLVAQAKAGSGLLYLTALWWDQTNTVARWVDMSGRPEIEDMAPSPPMHSLGILHYANVVLNLSNLTLENDPATF